MPSPQRLPPSERAVPDSAAIELAPGVRWPFLPGWVRDEIMPHTTAAEWKVLCVYIARADRRGESYPSIRSLCETAALGEKAVKKARRGLVRKNFLRIVKQERKRGRFSKKVFCLGWK